MVGLTISLGSIWIYNSSLWTMKFCTIILYTPSSPWPTLPRPFSLAIPNKLPRKKKAGASPKKGFLNENNHIQKLDGNDTTTILHHPYVLCHFANYAHLKSFHMHLAPLNEHWTMYSLLHKRQLSAEFSSNKISQHNLLQHTIKTQLMHSSVSTFKTKPDPFCFTAPTAFSIGTQKEKNRHKFKRFEVKS